MALVVFSQQMVEWLVFSWTYAFWDRLPPCFGIGKLGVHIIDHAPKWKHTMADNLSDTKFCDELFFLGF